MVGTYALLDRFAVALRSCHGVGTPPVACGLTHLTKLGRQSHFCSRSCSTTSPAYLYPTSPLPLAFSHLQVARSEEVRPKKLTYVSRGVRLLLLTDVHAQMKVTAAGVKLLERQDNKDNLLSCPYRLAQEGMACVLPYIQRQRFEPSVEEYLALLQDRVVGLPEESKLHITKERKPEAAPDADTTPDLDTTLPDADAAAGEAVPAAEGEEAAAVEPPQEAKPEKSGWPKPQRTFTDPATLAQMPSLSYGCCVAMLRDADAASLGFTLGSEMQGSLAANMPLAISCWRGRGSMNVLVSKQECAQVIERLQAAMAARDKAAQATTA